MKTIKLQLENGCQFVDHVQYESPDEIDSDVFGLNPNAAELANLLASVRQTGEAAALEPSHWMYAEAIGLIKAISAKIATAITYRVVWELTDSGHQVLAQLRMVA